MTPEARFLAELPLIERLIEYTCRRAHCSVDEAEEFAAWAKLRFIADDYGILRKFEGKSSLSTFLSVVLQRLFLDFRTERWGKWRPSTEAKRMGQLAVRIEELTARDGLSLEEAVKMLTVGRLDGPTPGEIVRLAEQLPARNRRRFEAESALEHHPAPDAAPDAGLLESERGRMWRLAATTLEEVSATLAPEDRLLLRLRFWQSMSVAEIAKVLKLDAKPLYRRYERLLKDLRKQLESKGIGPSEAAELFCAAEVSASANFPSTSVDTQ